jgi:Transglutaminase-like superfamily
MRCVAMLLALPPILLVSWSAPGMAQAPSPPPSQFESLRNKAGEAAKAKDWETAARLTREMLGLAPDTHTRSFIAYNLACMETLRKRHQEAIQALADAVNGGYTDWQQATTDEDLRPLRGRPEFKQLVAKMKALAVPMRIFEVTRWDNPDLGWTSLHRFDDPNQAKLKQLRDEYRLGDVIAGKKTELDKQIALMTWVHGRWRHDGWNEPSSSDALTILKEAAAGRHFRCVEYSVTLAQVLQAVGFPARRIGLRRDGVSYGAGKGHVVSEVWNNELGKWILLDGQNNATWRDADQVLDAAEVRERFLGGKADRLRMVQHGSSWIKEWKEKDQRREWVVYFHHLSYPQNNNIFTRGKSNRDVELIRAGESHELLFQGSPQVGHAQTQDRAQIYPRLNLVHMDLGTSGNKGTISNIVDVALTNSAPGFDHYLISESGRSGRQHRSDTFKWSLGQAQTRSRSAR